MLLDRFKSAQQDPSSGFDTALAELQAGRKTSHWIWYIFPQLASLGRSSTARFYGIADLNEACDYLADPLLRERLLRVTDTVGRQLAQGVSVRELMGGETDSLKLVSCLTLFDLAAKRVLANQSGPAASNLEKLVASSAQVLTFAGSQGFPFCRPTLAALSSAADDRVQKITP